MFPDGTQFGAFPHDTHHYHVVAHRTGYQDDILRYCREHESFHSFCAEWFLGRPSPIIWDLAHGQAHTQPPAIEEALVQICQRWARSAERPIIGGVDWDGFKASALALIATAEARP